MLKTKDEIKAMLIEELIESYPRIKTERVVAGYYNELMGDTSFLLVSLLQTILKERTPQWPDERWMDDSLLSKVEPDEAGIIIWGVAIWGVFDNTEQWVEPFCFKMGLGEKKKEIKNYKFWFSDRDRKAISYTLFRENRSYWPAVSRNWLYVFEEL